MIKEVSQQARGVLIEAWSTYSNFVKDYMRKDDLSHHNLYTTFMFAVIRNSELKPVYDLAATTAPKNGTLDQVVRTMSVYSTMNKIIEAAQGSNARKPVSEEGRSLLAYWTEILLDDETLYDDAVNDASVFEQLIHQKAELDSVYKTALAIFSNEQHSNEITRIRAIVRVMNSFA